MWPFKKKAAREASKPCDHKWKDYSWYMERNITARTLSYTIYEPYVCIHCKERKNVVLENRSVTMDTKADVYGYIEGLLKKYPQIKDRAIVEDEISDAQLVDREYLKYAEMVMKCR